MGKDYWVRGEWIVEIPNGQAFLASSAVVLGEIVELLAQLPPVRLEDLPAKGTALVLVDLVNGFAREGALKSLRVAGIIPEIAALARECDTLGITILAFADCHREISPEFEAYPTHCLAGTSESEVVDEIKAVGNYRLIAKNSTNGFLEAEFQKWLLDNSQIDTFVVTGDCTDICIQQFAVTLKTWFNMQDRKVRVIVPSNMIETYDYGIHNGDLMNVMALYFMIGSGVEVVQKIEA